MSTRPPRPSDEPERRPYRRTWPELDLSKLDLPDEETVEAVVPAASIQESVEEPQPEEEPAAPSNDLMPRGRSADPLFGLIVAVALAIGLTPLIPYNTDLRYVICWAVLAWFGILPVLMGRAAPERQQVDDLRWGAIFALIIGLPLVLFSSNLLATTAHLLFSANVGGTVQRLSPGAVLGLLLLVQPLAETLFFRGMFQETRPFWIVGLIAAVWSVLLYFPALPIGSAPAVGLLMGIALLLMNLIYSYVRQRNGLASAWLCQIVLNVLLLFIPYLTA